MVLNSHQQCLRAWPLLLMAMLIPSVALAHAVVYPKTSTTGAYEKYVLRVPNERDVPTTRIEIRFPPQLRIVSFGDVAGWTLRLLTDSAQHVTGAVWTGVLPKERFVEFPFVAVNPKEGAKVSWPTYQTYEGGELVEWTGPANSKAPASVTEITASSTGGSLLLTPLSLSIAAIVLSLISLGIAMRQSQGGTGTVQ